MTLDDIFHESTKLSKTERWQLVRQLLDTLEKPDINEATEDWHSFVNRMYGALADDPIERPSQLPLSERDSID